MELVDFLAARGQKQELLAELIALEAESSTDREMQIRTGEAVSESGCSGEGGGRLPVGCWEGSGGRRCMGGSGRFRIAAGSVSGRA